MKTPLLVNLCQKLLFLHQLTHNLLSYFGLVDATLSASEKDLPVNLLIFVPTFLFQLGYVP